MRNHVASMRLINAASSNAIRHGQMKNVRCRPTDGRLVNYSPRYVASLILFRLQRPQLWTQFFPIYNPRT